MIDQILKLGFEFDPWSLNNLVVFVLESLFTILSLEGGDYASKIFKLSKETLVLTSALNCSSSPYELGHLFEDFAGSLF